MYKLFLALRYFRKRLIAIWAVLAVALCTFMVLTVISVMDGFLEMIKERSRGLLSDIVVDVGTLQGFPYYQEFIDQIKQEMPDVVEAATPVIYNYGILRVEKTKFTKPVRIVGIRLNEYMQVNDFANSLWYNKFYPGTTTLDQAPVPVVGYDERDNRRLPPEFEEANARWKKTAPADEIDKYEKNPIPSGPGPRCFYQNYGPPGYLRDEDSALPGIIVGIDVLNTRNEKGEYERIDPLGHEVLLTLLPLTAKGTIGAEGAMTLALRHADDSRTRVFEIDDLCVYVDFDLVQRTLSMDQQELIPEEPGDDPVFAPARASQVLISLHDGHNAVAARGQIEAAWQRFADSLEEKVPFLESQLLKMVTVETWQERQVKYISAVEKEKLLVTALFVIISVVAVAMIGCIFYMVVEKKTRDIGIIKSLGGSSSGVAAIFLIYGAVVGVVGSSIGTVCGIYFVRYINDIQDWMAESFGQQYKIWSPDVYTFDRIPNVVDMKTALVIVGVAIVSAMLGALIPALLAARVWPVKALRYE